ncbi:MipA/OmpV family protein [Leisingera sp. NJS204]|uniref:MipA/OmpV family protein n=1 Tax=Leisingera sp. NJS204 TaxID=2508307 RepID=UPI001010CDAC|nr:MipA/OmpV family protein [Leisingera sp. NJS204]QAX28744.1 MipA/OmpV family protein [Leisingera sp. NJS204]
MSQSLRAPLALAAAATALLGAPALAGEKNLTGVIGLGTSYGPEFSGSDESSASAFPIISLEWGERYFFDDRGLGFYALRNQGGSGLSAGLAIGYDFDERIASDDSRLTGLRDVEAGAMLTAFLEYDLGFADFGLALNRGLESAGHEGTRATMSLEFNGQVNSRLSLSAAPYLVWADSSYSQAFYGVSPSEAAASTFAGFAAGSGFERVGVELQATYALNDRTGIFLGLNHAELVGDAKDSPVTFDSGQTAISTGIYFRF